MKTKDLHADDVISNGDEYGTIIMVGFGHVLIKWRNNYPPVYYPDDVFDMLLANEGFEKIEQAELFK